LLSLWLLSSVVPELRRELQDVACDENDFVGSKLTFAVGESKMRRRSAQIRFLAVYLVTMGAVGACNSASLPANEPNVLCNGTDALARAILLDGQLGRRPDYSGCFV
jgi:hypothetical protein